MENLLSTPISAERLGQVARAHWGVENRPHWVPDATLNQDQARNRFDNGPNNLAVLRHMALNILAAQKSKISTRRKIKRAGCSNAFLANLLAQI
jgi:predicted transposase YbfD/YdcC